MRDMARGRDLPRGVPVMDSALDKRMRLIGKPVKASQEEVDGNPRSRSAVMRVAEKIN
jgi:16S rRNA (cytosine1402-N4)-methyltransferase